MESKGTILLADDEETFSKATQTLLQKEGYECHTVGDAKELSMALHGNSYDLLITDLNMPGNRVMEMVDEIKAKARLLPVIVVTGYPSIGTAVDSVRLNVLEYMVKPIDFPYLLESVRKGIELKQHLQLARSINDLTQQQLNQLDVIEQAILSMSRMEKTPTSDSSMTSPTLLSLQSQLHEIAGMLKAESSVLQSSRTEGLGQTFVSDYFQLREGIHEAVQVLQLTKGTFRSKELANLRLKLQDLLKKTDSNPKS